MYANLALLKPYIQSSFHLGKAIHFKKVQELLSKIT